MQYGCGHACLEKQKLIEVSILICYNGLVFLRISKNHLGNMIPGAQCRPAESDFPRKRSSHDPYQDSLGTTGLDQTYLGNDLQNIVCGMFPRLSPHLILTAIL